MPLLNHIRPAIVFLLFFTILFGFIYPALITLILQLTFPENANGSLIYHEEKILGSKLIGQSFSDPSFFWSRPSATTPPYQAGASSGSNLNPNNPILRNHIKERFDALQRIDPQNNQPIPIDLVTASGSGLDPHISIASARYQAERIARLHHMDVAQVYQLIESMTEKRDLKLLGEPRVNVLEMNIILNHMKTQKNHSYGN